MKFPEQFRQANAPHPYRSACGDPFGIFALPVTCDVLFCLATDGRDPESPVAERWEHVSISVRNRRGLPLRRCPTWAQMCLVKDAFWDLEECVIQFHPPQSEHVNNHAFCLHLWKPCDGQIITPPSILVGIKGLQLTK